MFNKIFREKALQRLSTPEQFDIPVKIIKIRSWIFLVLSLMILISLLLWLGFSKVNLEIESKGLIVKDDHLTNLSAFRTGFIEKILVQPADTVKRDNILLNLVSIQDKELLTQNKDDVSGQKRVSEEIEFRSAIVAPEDGVLFEIAVSEGDFVNIGDKLLTLERSSSVKEETFEVIGFISGKVVNSIKPGAPVLISPKNIDIKEYGYISGIVNRVASYPVSQERKELLEKKNPALAVQNFQDDIFEINIKPHIRDKRLVWTSKKNPSIKLINGTLCGLKIISSQRNVLSYITR